MGKTKKSISDRIKKEAAKLDEMDADVTEETTSEVKETPEVKKYTAKEKKALRNELTHGLRFQILERDGYRCLYCGRSTKNDPEVQLEVDHITPLDMGGSNDESNLVTACAECNKGKQSIQIRGNPLKSERQLVEEENNKSVFEFDFSSMEEVESVGTGLVIRAYLSGKESLKNRMALWQYHEVQANPDCLKDCDQCMEVSNLRYITCFGLLRKWKQEETGQKATATIDREKGKILDEKLACDICYLTGRCPKYRVGQLCAYDFSADTDFTDTNTAWQIILNAQKERVMRGLLFEKSDGGVLDKNVTTEMQLLMGLLQTFESRGVPKFSMTVTGSGGQSTLKESPIEKMIAGIFAPKEDKKQLSSAVVQTAVEVIKEEKVPIQIEQNSPKE